MKVERAHLALQRNVELRQKMQFRSRLSCDARRRDNSLENIDTRKARIWRAFLIKKRKISENENAWLTSEDSNLRIPDWEMPFEMSRKFRHFPRNFGLETFAAVS